MDRDNNRSSTPVLVCPDCRGALQVRMEDGVRVLECPHGHGCCRVEGNIFCFSDGNTPLNNRWTSSYRETRSRGLLGWIHRRSSHWGIPHLLSAMLRRAGPSPIAIIDLGCGGGWEFLTRFGHVTGIDHGGGGLDNAALIYDRVICAPVERLPFENHSTDIVVSVWLFEHLREQRFVAVLREIRRVLKPGGRLIFFADLDCCKPIIRWAKRYPQEYVHHHIDAVGHVGLRSLRYTRYLLCREGFVESETIPVNKSSLLQPVTALWMFDNSLGRRSRLLRLYLAGCRLTSRSRFLHPPVYLGLMEYHRLADRLFPDGYAFSAAFDWIMPDTECVPRISK